MMILFKSIFEVTQTENEYFVKDFLNENINYWGSRCIDSLGLHCAENVQLLLKLSQVFSVLVLFLFDRHQSVVAFLQLVSYEVDTLCDVLLAVLKTLLDQNRTDEFIHLQENELLIIKASEKLFLLTVFLSSDNLFNSSRTLLFSFSWPSRSCLCCTILE